MENKHIKSFDTFIGESVVNENQESLNIGDTVEFLRDLFVTQESDEYDSERGVGGKTLKIIKKDENNHIYYLRDTAQNLSRDDRFPYKISFKKMQGWIAEKYVNIHKN